MNRNDTKRQLLTDLLTGKVDALRTYKRQQAAPIYRGWIIDERAVGGGITATNEQGQQITMSETEFEQLPNRVGIWTLIDATGGKTPPPIDE